MLIFGQNMTSTVDFGWKPTTTAIFVGIRHVGVNAPHHFSQKPPLNGVVKSLSISGIDANFA